MFHVFIICFLRPYSLARIFAGEHPNFNPWFSGQATLLCAYCHSRQAKIVKYWKTKVKSISACVFSKSKFIRPSPHRGDIYIVIWPVYITTPEESNKYKHDINIWLLWSQLPYWMNISINMWCLWHHSKLQFIWCQAPCVWIIFIVLIP